MATLVQWAYRWYDDDNADPNLLTAAEDRDTILDSPETASSGKIYNLRISFVNADDGAGDHDAPWRLFVKIGDGGTWSQIDSIGGASAGAPYYIASANLTDGELVSSSGGPWADTDPNITPYVTTPVFVNAASEYSEDGRTGSATLEPDEWCDFMFSLQFPDDIDLSTPIFFQARKGLITPVEADQYDVIIQAVNVGGAGHAMQIAQAFGII